VGFEGEPVKKVVVTHGSVAERIAQSFHETYERLAPEFGYRTRQASAVPWSDVPQQNKDLMIETVRELLDKGVIEVPEGGD
jgi:hypothetical protein